MSVGNRFLVASNASEKRCVRTQLRAIARSGDLENSNLVSNLVIVVERSSSEVVC